MDKLLALVEAVAKTLNILSEVANKQGVWHLIELKDVVPVFASVDFQEVRTAIKAATEADREALEAKFSSSLNLANKDVDGKVKSTVVTLEEAIDLVEDVVVQVVQIKLKAEVIYEKVKLTFGA